MASQSRSHEWHMRSTTNRDIPPLVILLYVTQAFQEELLEACGRSHSLADVEQAIADVKAAAPPSWSLDLISGLPQLTQQQWRHSLQRALDAAPPHISVYDLQVSCSLPLAYLLVSCKFLRLQCRPGHSFTWI